MHHHTILWQMSIDRQLRQRDRATRFRRTHALPDPFALNAGRPTRSRTRHSEDV